MVEQECCNFTCGCENWSCGQSAMKKIKILKTVRILSRSTRRLEESWKGNCIKSSRWSVMYNKTSVKKHVLV